MITNEQFVSKLNNWIYECWKILRAGSKATFKCNSCVDNGNNKAIGNIYSEFIDALGYFAPEKFSLKESFIEFVINGKDYCVKVEENKPNSTLCVILMQWKFDVSHKISDLTYRILDEAIMWDEFDIIMYEYVGYRIETE